MSKDKKSKLPPDTSTKEYQHYNAVLLEEIRSQMNGVIETVQATGRQLNEKIDNVHQELKQDIHFVQISIRGHSEEIKTLQQETRTLQQDTKALRQDTKALQQDTKALQQDTKALQQDIRCLDQKIDGVEKRLSDKIDGIAEKVERHDIDIAHLKSAVA